MSETIMAKAPRKTKTTNDMTNFETGAVRDTGGKGRMDLLPMCALIRISKHMEDALTHYPERNWEKGLPMHSMIDSALRHLMKYVDGQDDEDHLCAATTNLLMAMWTEEKRPELQDIPTRPVPLANKPIVGRGRCYSVCEHWVLDHGEYKCYDSMEHDTCTCGGDKSKCIFPGKRNNGKA